MPRYLIVDNALFSDDDMDAVIVRRDGTEEPMDAYKAVTESPILNEGLDSADEELKHWKAPPKPAVPEEGRCKIIGM